MKPKLRIYRACRMTGLTGKQIWENHLRVLPAYERHGIEVVSPVVGEGIPFTDDLLGDRSDADMLSIWKEKDKGQIRSVHAIVLPWTPKASQGVVHEYMYGRGVLWKKTVWVFEDSTKPGFISRAEDDYCATSDEEAALYLATSFGTWAQRISWRLGMLNRSLPKWVGQQVREFK